MTADTTRREHSGSGIRLGIGSCPDIAKILPAGIRGITLPDGTRVRMLRCVTREGGADIPVALIPATGAVHNRMLGAAGGQIVEFAGVEPNPTLETLEQAVALVRERILKGVWGENYFGDVKIVDVNIRRLRMKVEDEPSHPAHILTVWGYGYRWEE